MLILAFDTSERYSPADLPHAGSVALFDAEDETKIMALSRRELDPGTDHAADLSENIRTVLKEAGKKPADVDLVAVTKGPGSFTGLRVGVSAAKTFAFALGIPAVGINTLDAIAQNTPAEHEKAFLVYDARRDYVYTGLYRRRDGKMCLEDDYSFLPVAEAVALIPDDAAVFGPGCFAYPDDFPTALTDPLLSRVRIESVVDLAFEAYRAGNIGDVHDLNPLYLRPSAAEEKRKNV
ncbi:MAG: tRNA (adenosine(37)-N6)-threonylcarbamoyltransferase complex dimerization subunit type 1 TsaB [Planctomycetota bacterium]|nr:MAG: tRNA (adenosine(37)-N6)-threonylcarbamoyltransferase complex dimerization subunit type 1 TsaB [Planctomycetota bacterium]